MINGWLVMFQIGFLSYQILDKSFYEEIVKRHFISQKPLNVFSFHARLTSFDDDVGSGIEEIRRLTKFSLEKSFTILFDF